MQFTTIRAKQSEITMTNNIQNISNRFKLRQAVTIVEVLFSMFVVLFGLIGLVVLIPLAARQAGDSYSLTQTSAAMQNTVESLEARETFGPSNDQPWWMADDYGTNPYPSGGSVIDHRRFSNMDAMFSYWQNRAMYERNGGAATPDREALVEGLAVGYCVDPWFCASEFREGWASRGSFGSYSHNRAAGNLFRRTRMPFFDETVGLGYGSTTFSSSSVNFPKLVRVSYTFGQSTVGSVTLDAPLSLTVLNNISTGGGDILQGDAEDKSFGAIRFLNLTNTSTREIVNSGQASTNRVTWMVTLTPSEETPGGIVPEYYNLSVVVMSNRDSYFGVAPLSVTGFEEYPKSEKFCFATAVPASSTNDNGVDGSGPTYTLQSSLPVSDGGAMEMNLWSDTLTNAKVQVGDYVMLSRRIELANARNSGALVTPMEYKVIQRHRWYRVIGTDDRNTWPRTVRVTGAPWDYPETSIDNPSRANFLGLSDYTPYATTATIVPNVVAVFNQVVPVKSSY